MPEQQEQKSAPGFVTRLKINLQHLANTAAGRYRQMVQAIAEGREPEPTEAETILREAGKDLAELEIDLRALDQLQQARVTVQAEANTIASLRDVHTSIAANDQRLAEELKTVRDAHERQRLKLDAERQQLEAKMQAIETAKNVLRVHDPEFVRQDRARDRIQDLQKKVDWFTKAIAEEEKMLDQSNSPTQTAFRTAHIDSLRDQLNAVAQSMTMELDLLENTPTDRRQTNPGDVRTRLERKRQELTLRERNWNGQQNAAQAAEAGIAAPGLSGEERQCRREGARTRRAVADQERAEIIKLQREILELEAILVESNESPALSAAG